MSIRLKLCKDENGYFDFHNSNTNKSCGKIIFWISTSSTSKRDSPYVIKPINYSITFKLCWVCVGLIPKGPQWSLDTVVQRPQVPI